MNDGYTAVVLIKSIGPCEFYDFQAVLFFCEAVEFLVFFGKTCNQNENILLGRLSILRNPV